MGGVFLYHFNPDRSMEKVSGGNEGFSKKAAEIFSLKYVIPLIFFRTFAKFLMGKQPKTSLTLTKNNLNSIYL